MKCPNCFTGKTTVYDSRPTIGKPSVLRRRQCKECSYSFVTYEIALHEVPDSLLTALNDASFRRRKRPKNSDGRYKDRRAALV